MTAMPVMKLSVALSEEVAQAAKSAAEVEGVSLSAWLNEAAAHALRIEAGLAAMAEWEAEHGAFTDEEIAEADAILDKHGIG